MVVGKPYQKWNRETAMVVKLSVNEFNGCRNPQGEILQYEIHKVEEKEIKSWEDFF